MPGLNRRAIFADNRHIMFSKELLPLFIHVISSWQVIAVTIVIIFYFSLVSYVSRIHRRVSGAAIKHSKLKKKRSSQTAAAAPDTETGSSYDINDELGLEED